MKNKEYSRAKLGEKGKKAAFELLTIDLPSVAAGLVLAYNSCNEPGDFVDGASACLGAGLAASGTIRGISNVYHLGKYLAKEFVSKREENIYNNRVGRF
jgi:hypothetical protein